MALVYVCAGANLGDPPAQIESALRALAALPGTVLEARSAVYRSAPMGPADQPAYANAVAALRTSLPPIELLDALLGIERAHGRVRQPQLRNGPRHLDLDLLLYDQQVVAEPRLTLPHPGVLTRDFMLVPLLEIAPDVTVPGHGPAAAYAARCVSHGIEPWPNTQAAPA